MLFTISLNGLVFSFRNWFEFLAIYKDVFLLREYDLHTAQTQPVIIDCGAHIGVSALYFKQKYPRAKITCFEPTPHSFAVLKKNITQNKYRGIKLHNAALWHSTGKLRFAVNHDPRAVAWGNTALPSNTQLQKMNSITVTSQRLSQYITGRIDLLKLDIEGAELVVLKEIEPQLHHIQEIVLEFHGTPDNRADLKTLLALLKRHHFSVATSRIGRFFSTPIQLSQVPTNQPYLLMIRARQKS